MDRQPSETERARSTGAASGRGGPRPRPAPLSPLEWQIVALAERDHLRSLAAPSPFATRLNRLFGLRRQTPLAHPRLEALRRFAILAWHREDAITRVEIDALLAAGYSNRQMLAVLARIRPETAAAIASGHEVAGRLSKRFAHSRRKDPARPWRAAA